MNNRNMAAKLAVSLMVCALMLLPAGCGGGSSSSTGSDFDVQSSTASGHSHSVRILAADLNSPPTAGANYTTTTTNGHFHVLNVTTQQLTDINNGLTVTLTTSITEGHTHTFTVTKP